MAESFRPSLRLSGGRCALGDHKSDGAALSTFAFTRDANGNITQSLREDGSCWYYQYDGLQRLTAAHWKDSAGSSLYAFEYAYDKAGNRSHLSYGSYHTYYTYNAANELLHEVTPGGEIAYYTFDGRGNQTQRKVLGGHTHYFEYNSRNLITAIKSSDPAFTTNTFTYNALGQRITKTDSAGFTRYIWDGLDILLELDSSGNVKRRYTHGYSPVEGVSSLISVQDELGCPCFYHFDQVGGVRQLTDRWQNPIKAYAYEPFGRILSESGAAPNDFTFPSPYLMVPALPALRLSPTRLYDARAGRFNHRDLLRWMILSRDGRLNIHRSGSLAEDQRQRTEGSPVDKALGLHSRFQVGAERVYPYVKNSPTGLTDPNGLWGRDIHYNATMAWARAVQYRDFCAERLALADADVDQYLNQLMTGTMPWPGLGDASYHFDVTNDRTGWTTNTPNARGARQLRFEEHLAQAQRQPCNSTQSMRVAMNHLGTALHPIQDMSSHQEEGRSTVDQQGHLASTPRRHIGLGPGSEINRANPNRPDDAAAFAADVTQAERRTKEILAEFLERCPCCRAQ